MAKNKPKSEYRIPSFKPENLYVYFNSLNTNDHPPNITALTKRLYGTAGSYFNTNAFNLLQKDNTSKTIATALSFLGHVADNERNKEIRLIENYIEEIYDSIPDKLRQSRDMQTILNNLKDASKEISSGNDIAPDKIQDKLDKFYKELTTYINLVKQSVDDFQDRIEQLLDDNMESRKNLTERSFLFRVDGDIETALAELAGVASKKTANSFSSMMSETIFDYFVKSGLINNLDIQQNFPALLSGMIVDFEHFLQHDKAINNFSKLDGNYNRKQIEDLFESYRINSNTYFSEEMRKTSQINNLSKGFKLALSNFSERIGLRNFTSEDSGFQDRLNKIEKFKDTLSAPARQGQRNYIAKYLNKLNLGQLVIDNQLIKITAKTDQRHGTIYEGIQTIITGALSTNGHPATDTINIGYIKAIINTDGISDAIREKLLEMASAIQKTGEQERRNRLNNYTKELQKANQEIKDIGKELNDMLKPLLKQEKKDLFIYHESLKLYSYMEQSSESGEKLKRKTDAFHGRDLNALNAIDVLYSMDDGSNIAGLINRTALSGVMLNLSKFAIGGQQKATVAEYLSIFAGMIMFSDLTNMATEIGQMAAAAVSSNNDATHVHLYLLNNIYVPGSMILSYIYNAMTKIGSTIDIKSFAKTTISTTGADKAIKEYEDERTSGKRKHKRKDWEEMAEKVQKGTKVKITFMGTFLNLIDQIGSIL